MPRDPKARAKKLRVANEVCVLYHEAVRAEVVNLTKGGRRHMPSRELDEVDDSARRAFLAAAGVCLRLRADIREYVVAQFAMWRAASAYHKKFLLPSPQHMGTVGAEVRYLQHMTNVATRKARLVPADEEKDPARRFYVEERQLKGLARAQRADPTDVLADQPERFSRAFLEHKGAWAAVKDIWEERQA